MKANPKKEHIAGMKPTQAQADVVYDIDHTPKRLDRQINSGGEGSIWTLQDPKMAHVVVKMFHPHKLMENGFAEKTKQKINAIITLDPKDESMAWPKVPLFNSAGMFVAYAMRKVEGKELAIIMHPRASKPYCSGWDRGHYIRLGLDLTLKIRKLHSMGIVLCDITDVNFLVDLNTVSLHLVDIDSFQLSMNGKTFRCLVGRPEYTPPEYLDRDLGTLDRTRESDFFAVSVLLFQILMRGKHPFDSIDCESPIENIRRGIFPYGTGQSHRIPKGRYRLLWNHLPRRVKNTFIRAFVDGHGNPLARPNMDDWIRVLRIYFSDAGKGWHDLSLTPTDFKSWEYKGKKT